jgi:hypothetical protein
LDELGWEPQADDQAALDNVTAEIERGLNDGDYASLLVSGASVTDDEALRLISAALNT